MTILGCSELECIPFSEFEITNPQDYHEESTIKWEGHTLALVCLSPRGKLCLHENCFWNDRCDTDYELDKTLQEMTTEKAHELARTWSFNSLDDIERGEPTAKEIEQNKRIQKLERHMGFHNCLVGTLGGIFLTIASLVTYVALQEPPERIYYH